MGFLRKKTSWKERGVQVAAATGVLVGVLFVFGMIEFDHLTSSEEFCTTCHSMELVAEPYRKSRHYNSESGVRASCGDCHVSRNLVMATWDHAMGGSDLFKQFFGPDYDDPVINLLHLPDAAFAARKWFKERGSDTCLRCHQVDAIQGDRPAIVQIHQSERGDKSCVECHYNLVHRYVPEQRVFKRERWNEMVEKEFNLDPGKAAEYLQVQ